MNIDLELQKTLRLAYEEAMERRHEYITLEHLLYALTFDDDAAHVLIHCGAELEKLQAELRQFMDESLPGYDQKSGDPTEEEGEEDEALAEDEAALDDEAIDAVVAEMEAKDGYVADEPIEDESTENEGVADEDTEEEASSESFEPRYTVGVRFVLQLAATHVRSSGKKDLGSCHVLAALFREEESHAVYFLAQQGVQRLDVLRQISHGAGRRSSTEATEPAMGGERGPEKNPLEEFCTNLNKRAAEGKIDPLVGREDELQRTIHILLRRRKNNPVFVGDAGVGKTAIVEGLATRIHKGEAPDKLKDHTIYSLDLAAMLAGTKFRGEFEERMKAVMVAVQKDSRAILFIDEIHTIVGAGAVSGGAMDAANMLKPALASGEIKCIGTTTHKEYRTIFEKDHALARRFQKVDVREPTVEETVLILQGLQKYYEEFHGVTYDAAAIEAAAELSARYIQERFLPDKAIDVIDEAGVAVQLGAIAEAEKTPVVLVPDVEHMVSRVAKIPDRTVQLDDRERLRELASNLKARVYGQDHALDTISEAIRLSRSGLGQPNAPIGSFLFAGPTGVGKTETAKQLAELLGIEFLRFDMSEYMEKHTVSRLIGSPPGYVGFDQGGQLTEAINRSPHCVLLLDEIEKAHEDIFNILLQVMDHATLTDNNGRKSDFRHVVLIMTTNTGARESEQKPIGFDQAEFHNKSGKAIELLFSPEFRNRLSAIVQFNALDTERLERVTRKVLEELRLRLKEKKIDFEPASTVVSYLAAKAAELRFGARPVKRLVETEVTKRISEEILFGALSNGGSVRIRMQKKRLVFSFKAASA